MVFPLTAAADAGRVSGGALRAGPSETRSELVAAMFGVEESDLPEVNSVDADGYAVMGERSFMGWSGAAIGAHSQVKPIGNSKSNSG